MNDDKALLEAAAKAAGMVIYDPLTGSMRWKPKPLHEKDANRWNARYADKECGTIDDKGYRRILFRFGEGPTFKMRGHRLAWLIATGALPKGEIDHINQDKLDNRLSNLRDVDRPTNQRNGTRKSNNTSGVPGVIWHKQRRKWAAQANVNGQHHHLGLYDDKAEAASAAATFRSANGFTETHGREVR